MNPPQTDFLTRLRQARTDAGLTLTDAAKNAGMSGRNVLFRIEHGYRQAGIFELVQLAAVYRVDLAWLIGPFSTKADVLPPQLGEAVHRLMALPYGAVLDLVQIMRRMQASVSADETAVLPRFEHLGKATAVNS